MTRPRTRNDARPRLHFVVALFLAASVFAVYAQVYDFDFLNYDDTLYITENGRTQQGLSLDNVRWAFTTGHASNWHPLTWLSYMLDVSLFGVAPGAHHVVNVLFHTANTVLLFYVLRAMTGGALWRSAFVAALFALHPLHVESVAWIAERKDGLSTLFGLLALGGYWAYVKRPSFGRYLLIAVPFVLSLMAKPMLVTLPAVLLLLDYWPLGRLKAAGEDWRGMVKKTVRLAAEKAPLFALALASSVVTVLAQRAGRSMTGLEALPLTVRLGNAAVSYVRYVLMTFWPRGLAVFYPHPGRDLPVWQVVLAAVVLAAVTLLVLAGARKRPYLLTGWLWYLGTLLPVIGIIQVGAQAMADRYTYVPLIGLFIMVTWGAADFAAWLRPPRAVLAAGAGAAVAALGVCAFVQAGYWRNNETLFEHALKATSGNLLAHKNLGVEFSSQGRYSEAIDHFTKAIEIAPNDTELYYNVATALSAQGRIDGAIRMYLVALEADPENADTLFNLGNVYLRQGRMEEAVQCYVRALEHRPDDADVLHNLGAALAAQGKTDEAVAAFREALRVQPGHRYAVQSLERALAKGPREAAHRSDGAQP